MKDLPRARRTGLIVQMVDGETLVYDTQRDKVHCLNASAAEIFRLCDGRTTRAGIAHAAGKRLGVETDERVVTLALHRLGRARLLEAPIPESASLSRRDVARRLGLVGIASSLLPTVTSVLAPVPAAAQSCVPRGGCCSARSQCCNDLPCTGSSSCFPPRNKKCGA